MSVRHVRFQRCLPCDVSPSLFTLHVLRSRTNNCSNCYISSLASACEKKRGKRRKTSTGLSLRDGYNVRAARERSTQAWQCAIEVGLRGRLRQIEDVPNLREAQLLKTA